MVAEKGKGLWSGPQLCDNVGEGPGVEEMEHSMFMPVSKGLNFS